ncbi:MAG: hypothetical protein FWG56_01850 [Desulfovibrionaceae bacterium]|nr:hypothetical protein [Desulfovibrionaceae bacterium]
MAHRQRNSRAALTLLAAPDQTRQYSKIRNHALILIYSMLQPIRVP